MSPEPIEETLAEITAIPVVVCIRQPSRESALAGARAVLDGGLRVIEVTLTTPGALEVIAELATDSRAVVGCGTALTVEDVRRVAAAGGRFVLSPVTDEVILEAAADHGLLAVPGAATPNEIVRARNLGARVVKVFPIGALGGPAYLRAIRGPLPDIPLMPTNGVTLQSLPDYFAAGVVAVGVGGEVLDPKAVAAGDWAAVTARAAEFVAALPG